MSPPSRTLGVSERGSTTSTTKTALRDDDPRVAWPIFTIQEAADYLGLPSSTVRGWARPEGNKPPLVTAFAVKGHQASIPFLGFAEAFVFAQLRRLGMKEHRIREGVLAVRKQFGLEYALASRLMWTDKSEVLWGEAAEDLTVVRTGQRQFTATVRDYLKPVTFADDNYASQIRLPQFEKTDVIVDPTVSFGYPLIEPYGVRVKDVVQRFWAGEAMKDISEDYEVPLPNVEEVIRGQTRPPQGVAAARAVS